MARALALRNPDIYRSVSAFAPVVASAQCLLGQKACTPYLGPDQANWQQYDAAELMKKRTIPFLHGILINQGLGDKFLQEQLLPNEFETACAVAQQPLTLRRHADYDHSYYLIATFIEDPLAFHQRILGT